MAAAPDVLLAAAIGAAERGLVPDALVRAGIRRICRERLRNPGESGGREFLEALTHGPIALVPDAANEQHYEAPVELFERALGPRLKYSCAWWPAGVETLAAAEETALAATCERAGLADGQDVLELGCGWGSLSLWMAERYPSSRILAVSNSRRQRNFILGRAARWGLHNLDVVTADMNHFDPGRRFDRVLSVEMFEHMRNYAELLRRIAGWMRPEASLFVHLFCHRTLAYPYEADGPANWLGRYFFSGGLMPSASLLRQFTADLQVTEQWRWNGTHYARTANAWLHNLDAARGDLLPVFERHYGAGQAHRWFARWRIFFMACAELWAYAGGDEWFVAHYRLTHAGAASALKGRGAA